MTVVDPSTTARLLQSIVNLDAWLESMHQNQGYGGPVAHWWRHSLLYTGPGFDWRYEGILQGYGLLYEKTQKDIYLRRIHRALRDVAAVQRADGAYGISGFERNPEDLGTPHEAAIDVGILSVLPYLEDRDEALRVVALNLRYLIDHLWDTECRGFNDRPGITGRVPNKLATLAEALLAYGHETHDDDMTLLAVHALDDVCRYVVPDGAMAGAVHQYAAHDFQGDGRYFPYYAARCVPGLLAGAQLLGKSNYREAALQITEFLKRSMHADGSWSQVIYHDRVVAENPRWIAGAADIVRAIILVEGYSSVLREPLDRILAGQLRSGGVRTAEGFRIQRGLLRAPYADGQWLDVVPVVGWNDKVLRLLAMLLPESVTEELPEVVVADDETMVMFHGLQAVYREDAAQMTVQSGNRVLFRWDKSESWADTTFRVPSL